MEPGVEQLQHPDKTTFQPRRVFLLLKETVLCLLRSSVVGIAETDNVAVCLFR